MSLTNIKAVTDERAIGIAGDTAFEFTDSVTSGNQIAYSPDGALLVRAPSTASTVVYDGNTFSTVRSRSSLGLPSLLRSCAFSSDGALLAIAHGTTYSPTTTISLYDTATWSKVAASNIAFSTAVTKVIFRPGTGELWAFTNTSTVRVYTPGSWVGTTYVLPFNVESVHQVAFSPDGSRLYMALGYFTLSNTPTFRVLDVATWTVVAGVPLTTRQDYSEYSLNIALSPDGSKLALARALAVDSRGFRLYNTEDWSEIPAPVAVAGWPLAFSPDGTRLMLNQRVFATGLETVEVSTDDWTVAETNGVVPGETSAVYHPLYVPPSLSKPVFWTNLKRTTEITT